MGFWLFVLLVVMQIADVCTSYLIIKRGIGREANPIVAWLIGRLGLLPGLIALKTVFLALLYLAGLELTYTRAALGLLCVAYLLVVLNNITVIRKAR